MFYFEAMLHVRRLELDAGRAGEEEGHALGDSRRHVGPEHGSNALRRAGHVLFE